MKILGIGNAIVDVICKVDDNFITQNGLTKSTMKLIFDDSEFKKLLSNLKIEKFTWHSNYKMWKLAADHYGDPSYWWIIAWFNNKPTDAHFSLGNPVLVPFPLARVLSYHGI